MIRLRERDKAMILVVRIHKGSETSKRYGKKTQDLLVLSTEWAAWVKWRFRVNNHRSSEWVTIAPSVNLPLPPVGWHRIVEQEEQWMTVEGFEKMTLTFKQPMIRTRVKGRQKSSRINTPGHLTSKKQDFGCCTRHFNLCCFLWDSREGLSKSTARGWRKRWWETIEVNKLKHTHHCGCFENVVLIDKCFRSRAVASTRTARKFCGYIQIRFECRSFNIGICQMLACPRNPERLRISQLTDVTFCQNGARLDVDHRQTGK